MSNILLNTEYGTPHNCIPFDRITTSDFEPAILEGMRQEDEAIKLLQARHWPGNIRELRNVVERLLILGGNPVSAKDVTDFV